MKKKIKQRKEKRGKNKGEIIYKKKENQRKRKTKRIKEKNEKQ